MNSNAWKHKVRIPMFEKIRSKFQCWERLGQNSNLWKDMVTIPTFGKIGIELQCLKG